MANEKRLIDASHIVEVAKHAYSEWNLAMAAADGQRQINQVYKMKELCKAVKAVADAAPTVDAVEVVHGRWIDLEPEIGLFACSECDHRILRAKCNFCPNCGARMDGDGDEQT